MCVIMYRNTTDQEINKTIAEHIQWKPAFVPTDMTGKPFEGYDIPNYCNSLDAMHEVENILNDQQYENYWNHLVCICVETGYERMNSCTAKMKAEAFLRTIGKWKE